MRLLIIGASGFIGHAACRALRGVGHDVLGMAPDVERARRTSPDVFWVAADPLEIRTVKEWEFHLRNMDVVLYVNRAEQKGAEAFDPSFDALLRAAENCDVKRLVKLTTTGQSADGIPRCRGAYRVEQALQNSSLDWVILRPGLVIGPGVNDSLALLRLGASLPGMLPQIDRGARVQTISLNDLLVAIDDAITGRLPVRRSYDLVEADIWTAKQLTSRFRTWLGLPRVHRVVHLPEFVLNSALVIGQGLEKIGWRTPLGNRALGAMLEGIQGDSTDYVEATGHHISSFDESLNQVPATTQERWYTRFYLFFPVILTLMSIVLIGAAITGFFTGTIPLLSWQGLEGDTTLLNVLGVVMQVAFMAVGFGIVWPRFSRVASYGVAGLCILYGLLGIAPMPDGWGAPVVIYSTILPLFVLSWLICMMLESK